MQVQVGVILDPGICRYLQVFAGICSTWRQTADVQQMQRK